MQEMPKYMGSIDPNDQRFGFGFGLPFLGGLLLGAALSPGPYYYPYPYPYYGYPYYPYYYYI
ncbi:hypothetical protein J2Y03_002828 [Neobacillus niacini]|nr:hypothetical protein [Neobacillus niacini]